MNQNYRKLCSEYLLLYDMLFMYREWIIAKHINKPCNILRMTCLENL
jgi:hypothetical protein